MASPATFSSDTWINDTYANDTFGGVALAETTTTEAPTTTAAPTTTIDPPTPGEVAGFAGKEMSLGMGVL